MKKISVVLFSLLIVSVRADDLTTVQSEIAAAKKQDASLTGRIRKNEKDVLKTKKELVKTASAISKLEYEKASVEDKIKMLEKKQAALLVKMADTNANLTEASAALVAMGLNAGGFSANAADYALEMAMLGAISERFDTDMKTAAAEAAELKKLQRDLETEHGIFISKEKKYKERQSELDGLLRARANQNQELKGAQYELQKKLTALSTKAKNLADLADGVAPTGRASAPLPKGKMRFPAGGMLLLRFGDHSASGLKSDGWHVRTRPNAIVAAPADGKIEFADYFKGYNRIAILNHNNGYYSVLTGMENLSVLVGQEVLAGEPIGRMPEKNPEIYLELRQGTRAINPGRLFTEPR